MSLSIKWDVQSFTVSAFLLRKLRIIKKSYKNYSTRQTLDSLSAFELYSANKVNSPLLNNPVSSESLFYRTFSSHRPVT